MDHQAQGNGVTHRLMRRIAGMMRRFEWFDTVLHYVVRTFQPRFTMGVVGVLLDETGTRVLLVEHVFHVKLPWGLPGGWIDRGEDPAETVEREFREETGLRVRSVLPLVVMRGPIGRHMDLVYLCEAVEWPQTITLCDELLDFTWVPIDQLPRLSRMQAQAIAMAADLFGQLDKPEIREQ